MNKQFISIKNIKHSRLNAFDNNVLDILQDGIWLAGGAIRRLINSDYINDFDLFFKSESLSEKAKMHFESNGYEKVFVCPEGGLTTFKDINRGIKVQIITIDYYGTQEELIGTFDFTCAMGSFDGSDLLIDRRFIKDTKNKELRINRLTYPSSTIRRLIKYSANGYYPSNAIREITTLIYDHDSNIRDIDLIYVD